jgi:hypothetical protein
MGLLKRFRASSSASTQPPANDFDDLPPPPLPHTYSPSQLFASVSRASVAESTTAATPKSSKFWKRKDKSKGKEKEVAGIPYESTPPAPSPSSRSASHSFHHVPSPSARSVGSGYNERPLYAQTQSTPIPHYHYQQQRDDVPAARGVRDGSATPTTSPRQETTPKAKGILKPRAMLGRMDFESSSPSAQPIGEPGLASLIPDADFASMVGERHSSYLPQQMAPRQSQPYGRPQTMILADERTNRSSQEEVMEHLVSPEKRDTWTPKSGLEARDDEVEDPVSTHHLLNAHLFTGAQADKQGSPTPRKSALPPQQLVAPASKTTADDHHAPSTRRPSASRRSSFIPIGNPFARRASVVSDLDAQVIDDGSFQITGFRHVSGASEADHGLDPYHRQQARAEIKDNSDPIQPPSRPASTAPAAAAIQRPVSRATSLASIDDHITSTAKVSAAAFRKGIRRASSNYLEADDDEDDVPLGLLRPGGRSSSALSLSSMREGGSARMAKSPVAGPMRLGSSTNLSQLQPVSPHRIRKSPSLGPAVGIESQAKAQMHTRTKTMPLISPDEIHPIFSSPSNSPVPSPKRAAAPLPIAGSSDYFAPKGQSGVQAGDAPRTPPVVVEANMTASPGFDFDSLDYPVSAFSTSPEVSKVVKAPHKAAPVTTKTSGLAVTIPSPSAGNASAGTSAGPGSAPKKEDREDTLDEDLVLRSMALYGDNTAMNEVDIGIENEPPARRIAVRQQSQSALSLVESESNVRSPLSERLGNLVIHGPRPMTSKPSLPKLNTLKLDDGPTKEKVMSPASDSTISPIAREQQTPTLSSSFARVNGSRGQPARTADLSDSEGTDSSDEESDARPETNVPPRSSFANAPRPVSNHLSTSSQSSLSRPVNFGSDDESDDEPLARIKSKASRSSLAVDRTSNHTPGIRPATIHSSSPNAKPSSRTAAVSTSPPLPPSAYARRSSVPTASVVPTPPTTAHMQGKVWDASPASSQSGLTGDSTNQPITPSDHEIGNGRGFRDGPAAMVSYTQCSGEQALINSGATIASPRMESQSLLERGGDLITLLLLPQLVTVTLTRLTLLPCL